MSEQKSQTQAPPVAVNTVTQMNGLYWFRICEHVPILWYEEGNHGMCELVQDGAQMHHDA